MFNFLSIDNFAFKIFDNQYPFQALDVVENYIKNFKNSSLFKDYKEIQENVFIGRDVRVEDSVLIKGGAIIGHNTKLSHACYLRGFSIIGENVNIGHAVEVKSSIVLNNSAIAHLTYIGDSIIGENVNIGGGTILANWRFDQKSVLVHFGEEKIDSGREKLGVILGDKCKVDANAVLNPGTVVGVNSYIYPLTNVRGYYPANSRIQ